MKNKKVNDIGWVGLTGFCILIILFIFIYIEGARTQTQFEEEQLNGFCKQKGYNVATDCKLDSFGCNVLSNEGDINIKLTCDNIALYKNVTFTKVEKCLGYDKYNDCIVPIRRYTYVNGSEIYAGQNPEVLE